MTASSADTAEHPLVAPARLVVSSPPARPAVDRPALVIVSPPARAEISSTPSVISPPPAEPVGPRQRCQVVAERRLVRRHQHRLALAGLGVLAGALGATIAIVDVLH
jgi:hypothetical protein